MRNQSLLDSEESSDTDMSNLPIRQQTTRKRKVPNRLGFDENERAPEDLYPTDDGDFSADDETDYIPLTKKRKTNLHRDELDSCSDVEEISIQNTESNFDSQIESISENLSVDESASEWSQNDGIAQTSVHEHDENLQTFISAEMIQIFKNLFWKKKWISLIENWMKCLHVLQFLREILSEVKLSAQKRYSVPK